MASSVITKENIQTIIERDGLEQTTKKTIRHALERKGKMKRDALLSQKEQISEIVEEIMKGINEEDEKNAKKMRIETANEKAFTCVTRSGSDCPKNIKNSQAKTKLTAKDFLESGKRISVDIDGNTLTGDPRAFSSGNLGWYLTGKIDLDVNNTKIWAQVGMNITIPGSQSWSKK